MRGGSYSKLKPSFLGRQQFFALGNRYQLRERQNNGMQTQFVLKYAYQFVAFKNVRKRVKKVKVNVNNN